MNIFKNFRESKHNLEAHGINVHGVILAGRMTIRKMKYHAKSFNDYDGCNGVKIYLCNTHNHRICVLTSKYKSGRYTSITNKKINKLLHMNME